ncbi:hypothetical protein BDU57DRAFT_580740 [Ampelomyces quisqualis]|uniref:Uncharacterized protein n=1 Tax=Ampelomyces quisqualis TaxID=50730 RepID=A0A6A5QF74_AMPQU|nr:hypothetical protein BDU57DRAFT_580740 [Ampelomyces quisqualis]
MSAQAACSSPVSQSVADAALLHLSTFVQSGVQPQATPNTSFVQQFPAASASTTLEYETISPINVVPSIELTPASVKYKESEDREVKTFESQSTVQASSRSPPSLLRFVDGVLMQSAPLHNKPLHPDATCCVCFYPWNTPVSATQEGLNGQPPVTSTFLPLWPCGHWAHYRCIMWFATRFDPRNNRCCTCNTQLFEWEGITTLTLATRTGLDMEDVVRSGHLQPGPYAKQSDKTEYEAECTVIDSIIHATFFQHLAKKSKHTDQSPDLVQCFYDVLDALQRMKRPQSRWLQYVTQTGYLLWGMLVTIKMRRYLVEKHGRIEGTMGWNEFEEGKKALQGRIEAEVQKS